MSAPTLSSGRTDANMTLYSSIYLFIFFFRNSLDVFTTTMTDSMSNLKEKKYLRSWVQAAFLMAVTWAFGGTMGQEQRQASAFQVFRYFACL